MQRYLERARQLVIEQGTKIVHLKREGFTHRIDRQTCWGNPHFLADTKSERARIECLIQYIESLDEKTIERAGELRGGTLGCWCAPKLCHGEVLATIAAVDLVEHRHLILAGWAQELDERLEKL